MITHILEKLRNECDYDCMYCNKTLQQYCCEKSEEEERKRNKKINKNHKSYDSSNTYVF